MPIQPIIDERPESVAFGGDRRRDENQPLVSGKRRRDYLAEERRKSDDRRILGLLPRRGNHDDRRGTQRRRIYFSIDAANKYPQQMDELDTHGQVFIGEPFKNIPWENFEKEK